MGTGEGDKKCGVPGTWEGSQEKDLGTKVGLFFPNTPSPQIFKDCAKGPTEKKTQEGGRKARNRRAKEGDVGFSEKSL